MGKRHSTRQSGFLGDLGRWLFEDLVVLVISIYEAKSLPFVKPSHSNRGKSPRKGKSVVCRRQCRPTKMNSCTVGWGEGSGGKAQVSREGKAGGKL